ncbi:MAG: hypothetical protein AAFY70_13750, partial [Bacteroidota bacterium]
MNNYLFGLGGLYEDAKAFHSLRSKRARGVDQAKRAETIIDPSDEEGLVAWLKSPNKMDVMGIDAAGATQPTGLQAKKRKTQQEEVAPPKTDTKEASIPFISETGIATDSLAIFPVGETVIFLNPTYQTYEAGEILSYSEKYQGYKISSHRGLFDYVPSTNVHPKDWQVDTRIESLKAFLLDQSNEKADRSAQDYATLVLELSKDYARNIDLLKHDIDWVYG